ncbi:MULTISPECIES: hypothetical protein [Lysobacteraceae]|uniref:Transmembrane protein n=1 Tax=Novilysobacter avium TaxID=2781023 RepID=A0A7S6UKA5_9GAMM|nr:MULTISPECIES: hypothetical protein [Lysobacter]QOW21882.1 hypothetical protein INQ42_11755 [Lysobacter avium]QOW24341.1 hypothetical protein INQ43_11685 [Lysobacter sp. H23M47]
MSNQEWDALAAQWDSMSVGDPAVLQQRLRRHARRTHLGLIGELGAFALALAMIGWAWVDDPGMRRWLVVAGVLLVACQGIYLVLRRRYRLFGSPERGLVGLIDAEIGRARFILATHWAGVPIALVMVAFAWVLIPSIHLEKVQSGTVLAGALYLPYLGVRTWQMLRRIRSLRRERAELLR